MATIAKLAVVLTANTAQLQKGMKRAGKTLRKFKKQVGKTAKALASLPTLLAASGVALFGKSLIQAASDAEETQSKFDAVFKEQAKSAEAWAQAFSNSIGRGKTEVKGFLASIQDTFVPLGFARLEARKLSQQVVKLAVDLASFNNIADSDALARLQGALIGNHENVRQFGVIITEATLKQELFSMGVIGGTKAATNQEKALARLNLIIKGTSDAQGDAARTADGFANSLKAMQAAFKDLQEIGGKALLPGATKTVKDLADILKLMGQISGAIKIAELQKFTTSRGEVFTAKQFTFLQKGIRKLKDLREQGAVLRSKIISDAGGKALSAADRKELSELNTANIEIAAMLAPFERQLARYKDALNIDARLQDKKVVVAKKQAAAAASEAGVVAARGKALSLAQKRAIETVRLQKLRDAGRKLIDDAKLIEANKKVAEAAPKRPGAAARAPSGRSVGLGRFETVAGLRAMASDIDKDIFNQAKQQTTALKSIDGKLPAFAVSAP